MTFLFFEVVRFLEVIVFNWNIFGLLLLVKIKVLKNYLGPPTLCLHLLAMATYQLPPPLNPGFLSVSSAPLFVHVYT